MKLFIFTWLKSIFERKPLEQSKHFVQEKKIESWHCYQCGEEKNEDSHLECRNMGCPQ